jgi:type 1 glutamine amidotransferase
MGDPIRAYLVCGGKYHDIDFARVELLKLLGENPEIRTRVAEDYADTDAIAASDFLLTYTCDVRPEPEQEEALARYVSEGGRWFALHGTNAVLDMLQAVTAPRSHPKLMQTLGSQFIAHPPIQPYTVTVADAGHPLVKDVEPFEATDELYLCEYHGDVQTLLETRYTGDASGFVEVNWPDDEARPVLYLHPYGKGEVLYFTLGHCRGRWDMRPVMDEYPVVERCSWELPVFYELLRRSLRWARGEAV